MQMYLFIFVLWSSTVCVCVECRCWSWSRLSHRIVLFHNSLFLHFYRLRFTQFDFLAALLVIASARSHRSFCSLLIYVPDDNEKLFKTSDRFQWLKLHARSRTRDAYKNGGNIIVAASHTFLIFVFALTMRCQRSRIEREASRIHTCIVLLCTLRDIWFWID